MNTFKDLYSFLELAKNNRKYTESVANNLKSALKIFESVINEQEKNSIDLIKDNMEPIFLEVVNYNNEKDIASLNAYKNRFLRVVQDYKKYGENPSKIQNWEPRERKSTPLLNGEDKKDKEKDKISHCLSTPINNPVNSVNKIELSLENGNATIILPTKINSTEIKKIKSIIDDLTQN